MRTSRRSDHNEHVPRSCGADSMRRNSGDDHWSRAGSRDRFPSNDLFEGRIAEELARLSDVGQIRIIDAVFVMREGDDVSLLSVSDLDDEQRAELRARSACWSGWA